MIAAVKGWHAAFTALLFFLPPGATAADDLNGAARELARKTAAFVGRGEPVSATWRNVSSLGSLEFTQARGAFEDAVREAGARVIDIAPVAEAHLTLSENQQQYLIVEEIRKGDDRQVWIAAWKRAGTAAAGNIAPGVTLEKKLVWEQNEPILDAAFPAGNLLVLSPARVTLYARQNGPWEARQSVPLTPVKPWPHDVRGHLRLNGVSFQAYLPGLLACSGSVEPALVMDCRPTDEPWVLESGSRAMLLAAFSPARNYFDGRVTTQTGLRKTVAPFFSAASVEEQGRQLWLLAMVDGRIRIFDSAFDSVGAIAGWGSDIAGTEARCGGGFQVLATKAGDAFDGVHESDSLRAFTVVNRVPAPLTAPVEFPGPVTALWPAGAGSVVAVAHDLATNRYAAYLVTVVCGS
jgi:hypothetical protein